MTEAPFDVGFDADTFREEGPRSLFRTPCGTEAWLVSERRRVRASDISDRAFIASMCRDVEEGRSGWACRLSMDLAFFWPEKVFLAKAASMIRRQVIDGCTCGCRGDFQILKWPED